MSYLNLTPTHSITTSGLSQRPALWRRIANLLQRVWVSECRRAERPDRVVPYY